MKRRASTLGYLPSSFLQTSTAGSSWSWTHISTSYYMHTRKVTRTHMGFRGVKGRLPWGSPWWRRSPGWKWGWDRRPWAAWAGTRPPAAWPPTSSCADAGAYGWGQRSFRGHVDKYKMTVVCWKLGNFKLNKLSKWWPVIDDQNIRQLNWYLFAD